MRRTLGTARRTAGRTLRRLAAPFTRASLLRRRGLVVHLGCGDDRLDGFTNIDQRPTAATDAVMNLEHPPFAHGSVAFAFSNAFFEHLYRDTRVPHLKQIHASLEPAGACCYIGLPYFRNVARFYVEKGPGTVGDRFDLFNVYRYTHGNPEQASGWWLGQLHKSLFDEDEIVTLLDASGFASHVVFCYGYPGDAHELPVTIGFYATKQPMAKEDLRAAALAFLERFDNRHVRVRTLEWLVR